MKYLLFSVILLSGCASGMKTYKFPDTNIDSRDKTFVYLSRSQWDGEFRIALLEEGFKVKKYSSIKRKRNNQIQVGDGEINEDESSYHKAEARYGISLEQGKVLDWCPFNDQIKANFELEITDLSTNDVVLLIMKGNWTGICGPFSVRSEYIFKELAAELKKQWIRG